MPIRPSSAARRSMMGIAPLHGNLVETAVNGTISRRVSAGGGLQKGGGFRDEAVTGDAAAPGDSFVLDDSGFLLRPGLFQKSASVFNPAGTEAGDRPKCGFSRVL